MMSSTAENPPVRRVFELAFLFRMPMFMVQKEICGPGETTTGGPLSNRGATEVL